MAKGRTYRHSSQPTGLAYASAGCLPASKLINPNVTGVAPPKGTSFSAGSGVPLRNVHVQLVFWGKWWAGNSLVGQVINAVTNLLAGPYMSYLAQYGVHRGTLLGTAFATDSEPGGAGSFSLGDAGSFVTNLLDNGRLIEPDWFPPMVYAVIMPQNSAYKGFSPPDTLPLAPGAVSAVIGENNWLQWSDSDFGGVIVEENTAYYLWVGNDGTLDFVTTVLSHELAELVTDPSEGNGVRQVGCTGGSCQIGDVLNVCQGWCDYVRGVKAQGYWSQLDATGALPTMYSVRRTLAGRSIGGKIPRPNPSVNAWITGQF